MEFIYLCIIQWIILPAISFFILSYSLFKYSDSLETAPSLQSFT